MVAELVETSRLWGRDAARDRARAGSSRWPSTWSSAPTPSRAGSAERGAVVATERVTLYGLPIVPGARSPTGASTRSCRASCSSAARSSRATGTTRHDFLARQPPRCVEEVEALEERARRRDLLVDDEALFALLRRAHPGGRRLGRALRPLVARRAARAPGAARLHARAAGRRADAPADRRRARRTWRQGDLVLPLSYRFEPGAAARRRDRPRAAAACCRSCAPTASTGSCPAFRQELVTALIRVAAEGAAPPARAGARRRGARCSRGCEPRAAAARRAVARAARRCAACAIPRERVGPRQAAAAPADDASASRTSDGRVVAEGDDLDALREAAAAAAARASSPPPRRRSSARGLRDVDDRRRCRRRSRCRARAARCAPIPALVDEGDDRRRARARDAGRAGGGDARRHAPAAAAHDRLAACASVQRRLGNARSSRSPARRTAAPRAVLDDAVAAAVDALVAEAGGPAWDEAGFAAPARPRRRAAGRRTASAVRRADRARSSTPRARSSGALEALARRALRARAARRRSASSAGSCRPGFATADGAARLPDVERYLRAAARRLERLPDAPAPRPRPDARRSTSSRRPTTRGSRRGRRPPAARRPARGPLDARGAARQPLRPGRSARAARCRRSGSAARSPTPDVVSPAAGSL